TRFQLDRTLEIIERRLWITQRHTRQAASVIQPSLLR
ncbi:MAG: hypothetical protein FD138_4199, partial [Planctomycetota bacterium]